MLLAPVTLIVAKRTMISIFDDLIVDSDYAGSVLLLAPKIVARQIFTVELVIVL